MQRNAPAALRESFSLSGKSAGGSATMAKSQAAGSHRSRVACGGGPTRDIVRRWPGSNASWVIDGVGFRVRATLWSGDGGVKDQIGFSAHGLPNEVTGQIEIQEVANLLARQ
jgi:hypothetical protein